MGSMNFTSQEETKLFYTPTAFDFFELMKPRVMSLVVFTTLVGMYMSPYQIHPVLSSISLLSIALGAGSAGAINQWIDRDIDKIMLRTKERPIPSGRIDPAEAITFSLVTSLISVILLGLASNWLAAFLLAFTIFFYAVIYSIFLKRKTAQNIVIGGIAGSLPPVIGWAAMTGSIGFLPCLLFLIVFLWTPPHFWALALVKSEDYTRAKIPMMPNIVGEKSTKLQIIMYSFLVLISSILPNIFGFAGNVYLLVSLPLGLIFLTFALTLMIFPKNKLEMHMFGYSIFYLFGIFLAFVLDKFIHGSVL